MEDATQSLPVTLPQRVNTTCTVDDVEPIDADARYGMSPERD
jgi:hypothetical protein